MTTCKELCKEIDKLSDEYNVKSFDKDVIKLFADIALKTVKREANSYHHLTNAGLYSCRKFDASHCWVKRSVKPFDAFQLLSEKGIITPTDNSGWCFELTELSAVIVRMAVRMVNEK